MTTHDELLAQLPSVRRLARALARDLGTADDLVQQAVTEALEQRPAVPLGPWLASRVRSLAGRERRSVARRGQREARALRADATSVELVLGTPKLKRAMADADRAGAARIYLLGPDEVGRGIALERDLASGEQREVPLD